VNRTQSAAEIMLASGAWYTAKDLADEMGIGSKPASGLLFNIRKSPKYNTEETDIPNRKVKLNSISGHTLTRAQLWDAALFGAPL
jgi:hypothetical protein